MNEEIATYVKNCDRRLWDAMVACSVWIILDVFLIYAFFACGAMKGRRRFGSLYARNIMIPIVCAVNFAIQVMIIYVYCKSSNNWSTLIQASFWLTVSNLVLSLITILDLGHDACREESLSNNSVSPYRVQSEIRFNYGNMACK